jgi:hypothetical protein
LGKVYLGQTRRARRVIGTETDQESLRPVKTRSVWRVWNQRFRDMVTLKPVREVNLVTDQERPVPEQTLGEAEESRPGESGTGRGKTRRAWNRKRKDQESLEPEERRPRESGIGRGKTRRGWNRKRVDQVSLEPEEVSLRTSGTGREKTTGIWNWKRENP